MGGWVGGGGDGEGVGAAGVFGGGEVGTVALAGEVEEEYVGSGVDVSGGGGGLLIGEVAATAHDAVLEEVGPIGGALELWAVVGFDGEDIDAGEEVEEIVGRGAEIGGEAEGGGVDGDSEGGGAEVVVAAESGAEFEAVEGSEGVIEDFGAMGEDAEAVGAAGVAAMDEEGRVVVEERGAAGVAVIDVEVGEDDGGDGDVGEAGEREEGAGSARGEAGVDEDESAGVIAAEEERGAVAGRTAGESDEGRGAWER